MPIYEYLCEGCAHKFEVKQSMKDDPIATCERCGKPVQRLISSPAIMFKGSGWYITDYGRKDGKGKDKKPAVPQMSTAQKNAIYNLSRRRGISVEELEKMSTDAYGVKVEHLTSSDASSFIRQLQQSS